MEDLLNEFEEELIDKTHNYQTMIFPFFILAITMAIMLEKEVILFFQYWLALFPIIFTFPLILFFVKKLEKENL